MKKFLFAAVAALALVGCGGGGDGAVDLTGNWTGTATGTVNGVASSGSGTWKLAQSGSHVTGVSIGDNGTSSTIDATVNGNTVTGISSPSNPNNCSSQFVLTYSNNTLTGQAVTISCTVYASVTVTLRR
jgi:hypothetical protein